jgi:ketopantoate reductase
MQHVRTAVLRVCVATVAASRVRHSRWQVALLSAAITTIATAMTDTMTVIRTTTTTTTMVTSIVIAVVAVAGVHKPARVDGQLASELLQTA